MWQLICHLIGDYILQSNAMATHKTRNTGAAFIHAMSYGLPFLFLRPSPSFTAWAVIVLTHLLIDRFRLARYLVWAKNAFDPRKVASDEGWRWWRSWPECSATGYPPEVPVWMAVWLLIIADNTLHLTINALALGYL